MSALLAMLIDSDALITIKLPIYKTTSLTPQFYFTRKLPVNDKKSHFKFRV